ncbi:MAG: hypothetical protein Q4A07_00420 [Coriobacteriales bacterium]|nr:hypothetical protein [Coriobacteriales bacterium]
MIVKEEVIAAVDVYQVAAIVRRIVADGLRYARPHDTEASADSLSHVEQNESQRGTYQLGHPLSGQANTTTLFADGFLALRVGEGPGTGDMSSRVIACLLSNCDNANEPWLLRFDDMASSELFMDRLSEMLEESNITLYFGPSRWDVHEAYYQYPISIEARAIRTDLCKSPDG